jgi:ADP-heptose:LPS heptosyltransferase
MKRILVLQNQRIGDLLQTSTVLTGLREKHAPCHITLLANKMRADLDLGDLVDEVIQFDQNDMFGALSDPCKSIVEKYDETRRFLGLFLKDRFDVVIDVPADTHMHLIASMLGDAAEVRGALLSGVRGWRYTHPEVMLLYTIGLCREVNRFNLVDLQNLLAGVRTADKRLRLPVPSSADEFAHRFFTEASVDPEGELVVALQPGASEERKRWGEANFGRLAAMLVERLRARVILCGSKSEEYLAKKIAATAEVPIISSMGRTDVAQLAAILRRCRVLVTNDTGTMHVATAVGTPVIDLSTGPVFFRETGPYASGGVVVEADIECSPCNFSAVCHHHTCRERITPEMVFRITETICRGGEISSLKKQDFSGVRLHHPRFNDVGRLEFLPVFRYPLTYFQFLGFFYAHTWERFYGLRRTPLTSAQLVEHIAALHDLEGSWEAVHDEAGRGMEDFRRLESDLQSGIDMMRPLVSRAAVDRGAVHGLDKLQDNYRRLLFYGRIRPAIRHFTSYLEMAVESEAGAEPRSAVRNIHAAFRFVLDQVAFLRTQLVEASEILDRRQ